MKTINIEIPEGKEAKWVNGVLTLVDEQPKDITDRIKTFEDAKEWCCENGKENLIDDYNLIVRGRAFDVKAPDILAYLKLRIITCALNEGWTPTFEKYELRYSPSLNSCIPAINDGGYGDSASLLCFKSEPLAKYATTQFKDIYMDFCYKGKEVSNEFCQRILSQHQV